MLHLLFGKWLPDETDLKAIRNWRISMMVSNYATLFFCAFIVTPLLFTGLPRIGQVAWSEDVDRRIERALAPVIDQTELIKTAISDQDRREKTRTLEDLRQQAFEVRVAQCNARKDKVLALNNAYARRLKDLADRYEDMTGRQPSIPSCDDL